MGAVILSQRKAERQAEAPESQVLKGEQMRAPRPLQRKRNIGVTAGLRLQVADVRHPGRVKSQADKCIRLKYPEGDDREQSAGDEINDQPLDLELEAGLAPALEMAHTKGGRQQQRHWRSIQLGGHGHAKGEAKPDAQPEQPVAQHRAQGGPARKPGRIRPGGNTRSNRAAVIRDQDCEGNGQEGEKVGGIVRSKEVGLLDLHNGHSRKGSGQQTHFASIQAGGNQIE